MTGEDYEAAKDQYKDAEFAKGYAAALRDAVEAVKALLAYESPMGPLARVEAAVAAIEALGGDR